MFAAAEMTPDDAEVVGVAGVPSAFRFFDSLLDMGLRSLADKVSVVA